MKNKFNNKGFTLTEVIIGIMILTITIVTATSILVGLIKSNKNNVQTLQAYYMAQEGVEAVTNMRDTNWLNNLEWLGDESGNPWGRALDLDEDFVLGVKTDSVPYKRGDISFEDLSNYAPWSLSGAESAEDSEFNRVINVLPYKEQHVLVRSTVFFGNDKKVSVEKVLTNWKGNN